MYRYHVTIKSKVKSYACGLEHYNVRYFYVTEADKQIALTKAAQLIADKKLKILGEVEVEIEKQFHQF